MVLGISLFGIVGLALDGGQLYVARQRAQAAADAAAQAGVMDLYRGYGSTAASASAIAYGVKNGFASSEVDPEYPACSTLAWCNGHVTLSGTDNPNLIQVTVTRVVNTVFLRAVGINTSTVKAQATAAVTLEPQPVPILVLHPTAPGSFSKNGSNTITICGGPPRSIQVNSSSTTSLSIAGNSGTVDLSHAGPLDTAGDCTAGTGADFANVGLQNPYPGTILLGTKPGQYISPASPIADPLLTVAEPSVQPAQAALPVSYSSAADLAAHNCPVSCTVYSPGFYDGTTRRLNNISGFAILRPGIYWINHNGLQLGSQTIVRMASAAIDKTDPTGLTTWTNQVLIYNNPQAAVTTNDIFSISANSGKLPGNNTYPTADCPSGGNCFNGSPTSSAYKGILFFQSRSTATTLAHSLQGGGGLTIKGTIYLTHTAASTASDGKFQSLNLQGNAGGTTKVQGEIITDELSLGGNSTITMNLIGTSTFLVRQVALVQ
jgi:Flp pilus assembly protein TadG